MNALVWVVEAFFSACDFIGRVIAGVFELAGMIATGIAFAVVYLFGIGLMLLFYGGLALVAVAVLKWAAQTVFA